MELINGDGADEAPATPVPAVMPTELDELDKLRLAKLNGDSEKAKLMQDNAQLCLQAFFAYVTSRYQLAVGDSIQPDGRIVRKTAQ